MALILHSLSVLTSLPSETLWSQVFSNQDLHVTMAWRGEPGVREQRVHMRRRMGGGRAGPGVQRW